ncbi:unnamed protein product [Camellia sinensis]
MEGGRVYGGSNMTVTHQNNSLPCSSQVLESLWISNSPPSFHGESLSCSTSMVGKPTDRQFSPPLDKEEHGNEDHYDACFNQPEKKRRLAADQVQFLEKNFEVENKLEPERKAQIATELGLQPRQVAIWFQNRRARSKTKQLEKDYDSLKASYDRLTNDYECLLKEKERLRNEVRFLSDKLLTGQKENTNPTVAEPQKHIISNADSENKAKAAMVVCECKQEEASSAKSDVFDSDSPHCTEGNHSSILEPADSSNVFGGAEQSDFSQDDEQDELTRSLLPPPCFPKLEVGGCYNDTPASSCNWNFSVEGQPSWLWHY